MNKVSRRAVVCALSLALVGCATKPQPNERKLTAEEVKATFIGKVWHGPSGAFLFHEDGTYIFKPFAKSGAKGPWDYVVLDDGTLEGGRTRYTFYKAEAGTYRYFHSRSNSYYSAKPDQAAFL